MRLLTIELFNWQRFKGAHRLAFEPGVYAITATTVEDPGRSNAVGKSSLVDACSQFLLFGWHSRPTEDAWITDGEDKGHVIGVIGDESERIRIERSRQRGQSTQLLVTRHTLDAMSLMALFVEEAKGEGAQAIINRTVGMSHVNDLKRGAYIEQKKLSWFVDARPSQRQEVVADWLDLDKLVKASEVAGKRLRSALNDEQRARLQVEQREQAIERTLNEVGYSELNGPKDAANTWLNHEITRCEGDVATYEAAASDLLKRDADWRAAVQLREKAQAKYDQRLRRSERRKHLVKQVAQIDAEVAQLKQAKEVTAAVAVAQAKEHLAAAGQEVKRLRVVAQGEFNGACPVSKGFECPATDAINSRTAESRAQLDVALKQFDQRTTEEALARTAFDESQRAMAKLSELRLHRSTAQGSIEAIDVEDADDQDQGAQALPSLGEAVPTFEVKRLEDALREARQKLATLKQARSAYVLDSNALDSNRNSLFNCKRDSRKWAKVATILGRSGAQRLVAERGLRQIEAGANQTFIESGIALRVATTWRRPTAELAVTCETCGATFPKTKTVRACDACGSERGPKYRDELDLELSFESGGASDLAGMAYQLSAAAWLRRQRSSRWAVGYLDEPFGALDETHRRQVAQYLSTAMLARVGLEQLFVVAHHAGIMSAMPHQIRIVGEGPYSRVTVE